MYLTFTVIYLTLVNTYIFLKYLISPDGTGFLSKTRYLVLEKIPQQIMNLCQFGNFSRCTTLLEKIVSLWNRIRKPLWFIIIPVIFLVLQVRKIDKFRKFMTFLGILIVWYALPSFFQVIKKKGLQKTLFFIIFYGNVIVYSCWGFPSKYFQWYHYILASILIIFCQASYIMLIWVDPGKIPKEEIPEIKMLQQQFPYVPDIYSQGQNCGKCEQDIIARSEHCNICQACVLQYDHHCIFIGQCYLAFEKLQIYKPRNWRNILAGLMVSNKIRDAPFFFSVVFCGIVTIILSYLLLKYLFLVKQNLTAHEKNLLEQNQLDDFHKVYKEGLKQNLREIMQRKQKIAGKIQLQQQQPQGIQLQTYQQINEVQDPEAS